MNRIVIAAGFVLALTACGTESGEHPAPELAPVAVTVSTSETAAAPTRHPARVVPVEEAEVATRTAGTIDRVHVRVGDRVARGAPIATLDEADVRARIDAARASLELARKTFARVEALERDGAASTQEKDQATAQLRGAEAMVREAEAQAAYVEIRAPFAGVVTARMADPGDLAAPGFPLVQLAGTGVKVVTELPATLSGTVAAGDGVKLVVEGRVLAGTVSHVVPALNRASRRFRVEIAPEADASLLPGAFVRVRLETGTDVSRWIPADAVVRSGQLTGAFTVEEETLRLRWLRLGRTEGERVEVLAGPSGPLTVVRNPGHGFVDGQPVASVSVMPFGAEVVVAQDANGMAEAASATGGGSDR